MSPKNASSFALLRPMRRGSSHELPPSSASPRLAKISEKRARSLATTRSHASTSPSATPTAHAVDLGERGLRHAVEAHDDLADRAHLLDDRLQPPAPGQTLARVAAGEVGAGREVAPGARQDQRAIVRVAGDVGERAVELDPGLRCRARSSSPAGSSVIVTRPSRRSTRIASI